MMEMTSDTAGSRRVIGIGLDAAEWWLVDELMRDGRMPTLTALRESGLTAQLDNVRNYRSELPWTLFWTGRSAEDNGYWSTIRFDPATYHVDEAGAFPGTPFWQDVDEGKVVTFDIPHIPIFWDREDQQVTAWGAHSPQYARASMPRGLLTEVIRRYGEHPAFDRDHEACWFDADHMQALTDALLVGADRRSKVVADLASQPDWKLLLTVMSEPHGIGHHGWHGVDPDHPAASAPGALSAGRNVRDIYAAMDESIGRIIRSAPDATVAVFALHGMQANTNELTSMLMLPEFLYRSHFGRPSLSSTPPVRDSSSLRLPDMHRTWGMEVVRLFAEGPRQRLRRDVRVALPNSVIDAKRAVDQLFGRPSPSRPPLDIGSFPGESMDDPESIDARTTSCQWQPNCWWQHRWPEMPWFALPTYSDGHIRINLQHRERDGVVPVDQYQRTCDRLAASLSQLTNESNGQPAIEDIEFAKAADPFDPDGPTADVVIYWKEPAFVLTHPEVGRIGPFPFRRTGEHSSNGFAIIAGPNVPNVDLGTRPAADLAPTLLGLLGQSVPGALAGSDLLGLAEPPRRVGHMA